jgi:hypothetical protein
METPWGIMEYWNNGKTEKDDFTTEAQRAQRNYIFLKSGDTDFRKPLTAFGGQKY